MNLRPRPQEYPEVSLTPLIDVVLLLLIFFMISTTFTRESRLEISLPEASSEPVPTPQSPLEIVVDAQGRYSVDERELPSNEVAVVTAALRAALSDRSERSVVIRADAATPHRFVVRVMDVAARLGIQQLSIATVYTEESR
jgi:biopolymer transport protein ExbD